MVVTELEYGYNAIMVELRSYLMGDDSKLDEVINVIRILPREVVSELIKVAESNMETWHNMGILDDDGYKKAKERLNRLISSLN